MPLILEGLVTSLNDDDGLNVSPMGPIVNRAQTEFLFRPFQTSRTFANLVRTGAGVFHVVDDVLLLAKAAINQLDPEPETRPAEQISGRVLLDACRWYEFVVTDIDDSSERSTLQTRVVHRGHLRDVWGFNRAKHAVLELAVLATRLFLMEADEIQSEVERLGILVAKTAGEQEQAAFDLLREHIANYDEDNQNTF
ncbi:MAG: DUF447 family protein [Planctomycetaceae bacterium]|nr:DUF447 family protein [Planctomycetaceae bacterium]